MAIKLSTGHVNGVLATGSVKTIYDAGSEIRIYSGTVPTDADDALGSAVLLVTIKNAGSPLHFDTVAIGGVLPKAPAETWNGTPIATGTPSFYRHVLTADAGTASTTAPRYQGAVGVGAADMNLTSALLTSGTPITLTYHAFIQPKV